MLTDHSRTVSPLQGGIREDLLSLSGAAVAVSERIERRHAQLLKVPHVPGYHRGDLQLVPNGPFRDILADDYARMLQGGMLLDDAEEFDELIERCADIQERANGKT